MKNLFYFILSTFITSLLMSCDILNIEQDPSNNKYQAAATLIHDPSGDNIFITDDSIKLFPTTKITIPDSQVDSLLNKRYYISFQIKEQNEKIYSINLLSMQMMEQKYVIEINHNDSIEKYKNEVLNINNIWYTGQYLNIITTVLGSGTKQHNYNLLYNPNTGTDTLYLTLRYDNNNDTKPYNLQQALYYDIKDYIKSEKDSTTICFNYNSGYLEYNTLYIKVASK